MAGASSDVTIQVSGVRALLKALSKIDKELQSGVRDASAEIAQDLVSGAQSAAQTPLQALAASGLKVKRDRVPVVKVGSNMVRPGVRERDIFYGAEFGGGKRPTTQQFLPHQGKRGYFLYPTARANGKRYAAMWIGAVDKAFEAWSHRASGIP